MRNVLDTVQRSERGAGREGGYKPCRFRQVDAEATAPALAVGVGRPAADLHLAPTGFSAQRHQHAFLEDFDPPTPVFCLIPAKIEAGDFRAPQATGKADQQHRPVAQAAQGTAVERFQHGDQVFRQDGLLLPGRGGVFVADTGHHRGNRPVLPIQRHATCEQFQPMAARGRTK